MFRSSLKKLIPKALSRTPAVNRTFNYRRSPPLPHFSFSPLRYYCSNLTTNANPVALQMINYALGLARSQKNDESYAQALLVLEQGLTSQSHGGTDTTIENSKGMVLLTISSLLYERGNTDEAIQALLRTQDLTSSSSGIRVASMEALVGLNLELGLDDTSSVLADKCLNLLDKDGPQIGDEYNYKIFNARAKAVKGLVELAQGDMESAKVFFEGCQNGGCTGNAALSYGEFLHAKRDFNGAKALYEKVIDDFSEKKDFCNPYGLAACNMASEEVLVAATCALGQLQSHMRNFKDAEGTLTAALKNAEEYFGTNHPKVGTILTCIALMYQQKAIAERSSSLLVQEGLYRKAIDLLKAPPLITEDVKGNPENASENVEKRDVVALARGGYAETLCVQHNRNAEGESMKNWAQSAWKNRRLTLSEALDFSESSCKVPVVDARIYRVL